MSICYNNPEESSATKINKHTPSGYSIFTHCSFDKSKSELNCYRGEDCMKKKKKIIIIKKFLTYVKKNLIKVIKNIIK